jgi:hypothetical protein
MYIYFQRLSSPEQVKNIGLTCSMHSPLGVIHYCHLYASKLLPLRSFYLRAVPVVAMLPQRGCCGGHGTTELLLLGPYYLRALGDVAKFPPSYCCWGQVTSELLLLWPRYQDLLIFCGNDTPEMLLLPC